MRVRTNLFIFVLSSFFVSAVWCATLTAPSNALGSVTGCSPENGTMEMSDCGQFLCGFDSSYKVPSSTALSSKRSADFFKNSLSVGLGTGSVDMSRTEICLSRDAWVGAFPFRPDKVSIRLFNSILNL